MHYNSDYYQQFYQDMNNPMA